MNSLRGTIIKTPDNSPGLLFVDGQQKSFLLAGTWRSPIAPGPNMTVDVELDASGSIVGISAVDPQQLAKEKLEQLSSVAQQHGKQAAVIARQGVGAVAARMGKAAFISTILLWVSWFYLPVLSFNLGAIGIPLSKSFTFWQVLGVYSVPGDMSVPLRSDGSLPSSHAFGSFLGLLAIIAPLAAPYLRHPRAKLLSLAPLSYLICFYLKVQWDTERAADLASSAAKNNPLLSSFVSEVLKQALKTISYEYGALILVAACFVLAIQALKRSPAQQF